MGEWRTRLVYLVLIPAIAIAAGIIAYFTIQSAQQLAEESERSVEESTLALLHEKIDRVEQMIIRADEAVFSRIDLEHPESIERTWPDLAPDISPSVRALAVLDDRGDVLAHACRCSDDERRQFMRVFQEQILLNLQLEQQRLDQLAHHHRSYADESYLISSRAVRHGGRRHYMIAHHDTGYLVREVFPTLFVEEQGRIAYNVVDADGQLVFGESIQDAGDYLVASRFPSTLWGWRLQIASRLAPALIHREARREYGETALISLSFVVVLLGVGFLLYAAWKESRLNALRSEFIANVSHELKTPLSVVRMFSEMLASGRVRDDAKRAEYLQIIARESERLTQLIDNVLDFSAIERGKQVYSLREGSLHEVVTRAIETFRFRLEKDGVEVRLEQKGDVPPVRFDEQAILLAVMNLLDNAMKYGGGTAIEVTIERGRRHAYVRVRDRGPGIPPEHHKRVFERFFRVRSGTGSVRGSGIGLSLVKRIVEAHRGRAWAENAEDGGARVSFSLPLAAFVSAGAPAEDARSSWRGEPDLPDEAPPSGAARGDAAS